jgi:AraC-like DNA-binding protein
MSETCAGGSEEFAINVVQLGRVAISEQLVAADTVIRSSRDDCYTVVTASVGCAEFEHATRQVKASSGTAIVCSPSTSPMQLRIGGGTRLRCLCVGPGPLEARLEAMLGRPVAVGIRFDPEMCTATGTGRNWLHLLNLLATDISDRSSLLYQPAVVEPMLQALLNGLLLSADHPHRGALRTPVVHGESRAVRTVIDALHRSPERPYTLADLARLAGISMRTLQASFRADVGISPMNYVRHLRLARAHADLAAGHASTVAEAAHRWGFTHLGRFASLYRARYGQLPSVTKRSINTKAE